MKVFTIMAVLCLALTSAAQTSKHVYVKHHSSAHHSSAMPPKNDAATKSLEKNLQQLEKATAQAGKTAPGVQSGRRSALTPVGKSGSKNPPINFQYRPPQASGRGSVTNRSSNRIPTHHMKMR